MAVIKDFPRMKWQQQILLALVVCVVLLAGFWYWVLSPLEQEIVTKQGQLTNLEAQIAKSQAQLKIFEQFKRETAELQAKLDALKLVLPQEKEIDQLLRQVQQSASTSALRIMRVTTRPIIDHEVYTEWPIDMEVVGTYHNMGVYLDKIRQLPRIVNISGLRIQSRAAEGDAAFTASVGATYTATTFVYREEQIASTAPSPSPAR